MVYEPRPHEDLVTYELCMLNAERNLYHDVYLRAEQTFWYVKILMKKKKKNTHTHNALNLKQLLRKSLHIYTMSRIIIDNFSNSFI